MSTSNFQGQWQALPQQWWQSMAGEVPATDTGEEVIEETSDQGEQSELSELGSGFLSRIPEADRSIVEKYVKSWDSGVTRRFQDIHNQYKPYKDLGWDEDTTSQMAEVYRVLNEEPERLFEALKEQLELEESEESPAQEEGQGGQAFAALPPEFTEQLTKQQQVLEALAQYVLDDHTSKTQAVEDKEFEGYLGLLKDEYGDFDEKYVTLNIANGMDGEAAVKQWQQMAQEIVNRANQATEGLPPAMLSSAGGGAVVQQEQQKLGSFASKDIKKLIENVIGQANQAGQ